MSSPVQDSPKEKRPHEPGAFAAWGAICFGALGALIGTFSGKWVLLALCGAVIGWIAGALIDRTRL